MWKFLVLIIFCVNVLIASGAGLENENNDQDNCDFCSLCDDSPPNASTVTTETLQNSTDGCQCAGAFKKFRNAVISFSFKYVNVLSSLNPQLTVAGAPLLLLYLLALLKLFSYGNTSRELSNNLNVEDNDELQCVLKALYMQGDTVAPGTTFKFPSDFVVNEKYPLTNSFEDQATIYVTKAFNLAFDGRMAASTINELLTKQTDGLVENVITTPTLINSSSKIVYADALYFKPIFKIAFDPATMEMRNFYVSKDVTVKVPFVNQLAMFAYYESKTLKAQVILVPFKGGKQYVIYMLPNPGYDALNVVSKLENANNFLCVMKNLQKKQWQKSLIKFYLPSIDADMSVNATDILLKTNYGTRLFSSKTAQLRGIVDKDPRLSISLARQRVEISSTTEGEYPPPNMTAKPGQKVTTVDLNRPFVYAIMNRDVIIAAGVYANANAA